ncbi:MAG: protein translocase subunit SecD [Lachnospiraceae bacterium]|nr:protein translocase subunit SecD [Lachnospiraceae bacterium]
MSKQKSIVLFVLALLGTAFMVYVCIFGVNYKGMNKGRVGNIALGLDLNGGVSVTFEVVGDVPEEEVLNDTVYKLKLRADASFPGVDADVYKEGDNRINVEIPDADDEEAVLESLGNPGSLEFITEYEGENEKVWLTGADVVSAKAATVTDGSYDTPYVVNMTFTEEGQKKFADATEYASKQLDSRVYIVYNGEVKSAPRASERIDSNTAVVTGMADMDEAKLLADNISIGSIDIELKVLASKVVGAKLGEDAISTSLKAGLIGTILVMIFMTIVFRVPGFASAIALVAYIAMEMLAINGFNWSLTLPGIAGIILSIGMAVDANVVIFARIKEELAAGNEVKESIRIGFKKATSAIVDGNITTMIAAIVLMSLGSGPVKGFAQTLAVGIVVSMISAMVVTRVLVYCLYYMGFNKVSMYGVAKERKPIDFVGKRKYFITASIVVIIIGLGSMFVNNAKNGNPLNFSVEFVGGVSTTVDFEENFTIEEFNDTVLKDIIEIKGDGDVLANAINGTNQYVFRTQELDEDVYNDIKAMLIDKYGAIEDSFETVDVSSTISGEMIKSAITAVLVSVVCILIYIAFRFSKFTFGIGSVAALIHDILIVIGFYSLSWITVGNTFIACILTILGYSINATIVVFDRIREYLPKEDEDDEDEYARPGVPAKKKVIEVVDIKEVTNKSITQTLTRTLYSSFTTLITIVILYFLGVQSIKEFALPLIVGILAGGYSSVCIAGNLWYMMSKKKYDVK